MPLSPSAVHHLEQQVPWKPSQVYVDLQKACRILNERGLKLSAKWAAEQWMGLPALNMDDHDHDHDADDANHDDKQDEYPPHHHEKNNVASSISNDLLLPETSLSSPIWTYAKTLLDLGEFAHAAAILSQGSNSSSSSSSSSIAATVERMPPPLVDLNPAAFALRAYALYMAGERRKEEDYIELKSEAQKQAGARNPYLQQLSHELLVAYDHTEQDQQLDAFGLHVYGMVLKASRQSGSVLPPSSPCPQTVLIQSILQFPYNWSAWLDLADCCTLSPSQQQQQSQQCGNNNNNNNTATSQVEREIEQTLQPVLGGHYMYHFFCAHLQTTLYQDHALALGIYEKWMEPALFGGSPYMLTQCAVVHYHLRQFTMAKRILQELHADMPYRLDSMDVYSNILYVQEDAVALSGLAHTACQVDKYRAETSVIIGNYYSLKQQRAKAVQAFQRALAVDRSFVSAWTLMGHEYVEWKQTANAMEAYRRAVQVAPSDYRAWYGLGQTYELLSMHLYSLYYYKQAAQLRPYDARMWCALGQIYVQLSRKDDAIRAYERALQHDDAEGVATQKLAALYKEQGQEEEAAQCYYRHLQLRYQVTHPVDAMSGMAAISLDVLLQHLVVDDPEAEALLFLAHYHKKNEEYDTAAQLCSRLLEYPGPEKDQAKALLRELRSRKANAIRRIYNTRSKTAAAASGGRDGGGGGGPPSDASFEY